MTQKHSAKIASEIKEKIRERGLTQAEFADLIGISRSTIARLLKGERVRPEVRRTILTQLGIAEADGDAHASSWEGAPDFFGEYTLENNKYLLGTYIGVRRDFEVSTRIKRSVYVFRWIDRPKCICAFEYDAESEKRNGFLYATLKNFVTISPIKQTIDLFANYKGSNRLIKFSGLVKKDQTATDFKLYGTILSSAQPDGIAWRPASAEIVLVKHRPLADSEKEELFSTLIPGNPDYDYWLDMLALTRARLYTAS